MGPDDAGMATRAARRGGQCGRIRRAWEVAPKAPQATRTPAEPTDRPAEIKKLTPEIRDFLRQCGVPLDALPAMLATEGRAARPDEGGRGRRATYDAMSPTPAPPVVRTKSDPVGHLDESRQEKGEVTTAAPEQPPEKVQRVETARPMEPTADGNIKTRRPVKARPEGVVKAASPSAHQLAEKLEKRATELANLLAPPGGEAPPVSTETKVLVDDDSDLDLEEPGEPPGLTTLE